MDARFDAIKFWFSPPESAVEPECDYDTERSDEFCRSLAGGSHPRLPVDFIDSVIVRVSRTLMDPDANWQDLARTMRHILFSSRFDRDHADFAAGSLRPEAAAFMTAAISLARHKSFLNALGYVHARVLDVYIGESIYRRFAQSKDLAEHKSRFEGLYRELPLSGDVLTIDMVHRGMGGSGSEPRLTDDSVIIPFSLRQCSRFSSSSDNYEKPAGDDTRKRRFYSFAKGILEGVVSPGLVAAGGSVLSSLFDLPINDVDLFLVGHATPTLALRRIQDALKVISEKEVVCKSGVQKKRRKDKLPRSVFAFIKTPGVLTFEWWSFEEDMWAHQDDVDDGFPMNMKYVCYRVQFVLRMYPTEALVLKSFDLSPAKCLTDGNKFAAMLSALVSFAFKMTLPDPEMATTSNRAFKYDQKGLPYVLPVHGLDAEFASASLEVMRLQQAAVRCSEGHDRLIAVAHDPSNVVKSVLAREASIAVSNSFVVDKRHYNVEKSEEETLTTFKSTAAGTFDGHLVVEGHREDGSYYPYSASIYLTPKGGVDVERTKDAYGSLRDKVQIHVPSPKNGFSMPQSMIDAVLGDLEASRVDPCKRMFAAEDVVYL